MSKLAIGDLFEFKTSRGLAYGIYTHRHVVPPRYGHVIRVFDKLWEQRPEISEIIASPIQFTTFTPLSDAVKKGLAKKIGNFAVPDHLKNFPVFRFGNRNAATNKVAEWSLWDGKESIVIGELASDQRKLPIRSTWNINLLLKRIEEGWRPELDPR